MNNSFRKICTFVLILSISLFTACDDDNDAVGDDQVQKTIAETAVVSPQFSILVDALERTDLVSVLNSDEAMYTVFAPTNAAFVALLEELQLPDLDAVEDALTTEGLKNVLLYHVLGAKVMSSQVSTGYVATATADKLSIYINTSDGVMLNDRAKVTDVDIDARNGVIHQIDKVILPLSLKKLIMVNSELSSLHTALGVADGGLDALFDDEQAGPYTLFAPKDMAFANLLSDLELASLTDLVNVLGTDGLANVLTYHAVEGVVLSSGVPSGMVPTVNTENIDIDTSNGVMISDKGSDDKANVIAVDIRGNNGVIHLIDKVLLPTLD